MIGKDKINLINLFSFSFTIHLLFLFHLITEWVAVVLGGRRLEEEEEDEEEVLWPLHVYHQKHPVNFILLGLFTTCLSVTVGVACANTEGKIVLEALILTSAVVAGLTGYTFWAAKKGKDFSYLGPFLFTSLIILVVAGFMPMFFPVGPTSNAVFGGLGAMVFAGYLIYDTDELIKRHTYDEYIWASVALYLDILNLFLEILRVLKGMQSDG